jgi:hypothetical protein
MVGIGRRGSFVVVLAALLVGAPGVASAWHIAGTVLCDANGNSTVDQWDTRVEGVTVRVTALTAFPGETFDALSSDTGYYSRSLPDRDDDYRVEPVAGLPPGSTVIVPVSGAYGAPPVASIALDGVNTKAIGIDFLLTGCGSAPSPTPTGVETPIVFPSPTGTVTATITLTATPNPSASPTDVATTTVTATSTPVPTPTETQSISVATGTPAATATPIVTATPVLTATPLPTVTLVLATQTPTPVSTPGGFSPAFQCYEIDRATLAEIEDLPVEDRYGVSLIDLAGRGKVKRLCNPASINGQNAGAPGDPNHLVGYVVNDRDPRNPRIPDQQVTDQFGTLNLTALRPISFLVPSAKSLVGPPAPIDPAPIDHYQCYAVGNAGKARVDDIAVVDQFGTKTLDVKRASRLCVAADKRGEGVIDQNAALMCYEVRASSGTPAFRGVDGDVFVANQFGPDRLMVTRTTELCVQATVTTQKLRKTKKR